MTGALPGGVGCVNADCGLVVIVLTLGQDVGRLLHLPETACMLRQLGLYAFTAWVSGSISVAAF